MLEFNFPECIVDSAQKSSFQTPYLLSQQKRSCQAGRDIHLGFKLFKERLPLLPLGEHQENH